MENNLETFFTAETMFSNGRNMKVFTLSSPDCTGNEFHSHEYFQIMYVLRGVCHHWMGGKTYDLVRGDGFVVPPYLTHRTDLDERTEIFMCEFLPSALDTLGGNQEKDRMIRLSFISFFLSEKTDIKPRISFSPEEENHVEFLLHGMKKEFDEDKRYGREMVNLYIQELLIIFARKYDSVTREHETREALSRYQEGMRQAISYIDENHSKQISLEDICKVAAISKTNFCYLIKLMTQKTFIKYLNDVRISHAMKLLEETDESVTHICYEVGFKDLSHFARTFTNTVGVSAKVYRADKNKENS